MGMRSRKIDKKILSSLSCSQLDQLIRTGRCSEEAKREWRRRWGLDWPLCKTITGIEKYR